MKKLVIFLTFLLLNKFIDGQTFTVNFQPTSGNGIDANVQSNNPTLNLGSEDVIRFSRSTTGVKERSLLKFDLHTLPPGVDIISAKLILYGVNHTIANSGNGILQLVPDTWDESTVNWNISTTLKSTGMPTVGISSATSVAQSYTLDVLEMVKKMVNTPLVNFGWLLAMENENTSNNKTFRFGSSDNSNGSLCPKLSITYCNHLNVKAFVGPGTGQSSTDAEVFLNVTDGVPPYTYSWSNGASTKDLYNVAPGLYTVTITDARGNPVNKIIPVSGSCGTLSFSIPYSSEGFSNARLINESFNGNTANSNFVNTISLKANNISSNGGNVITRSLLAFDLDALPNNVQINQAVLNLTDDEIAQSSTFKVQLYRNNQSWNSRTVTFNEQPTYNSSAQDVIEFDYDGTQSSYAVDVTSQLQNMVGQVNSSLGWTLKLGLESPSDAGISASFKDPKITVQLTMPSFACDDNLLNWNQTDTYDENGNVISSEKIYLDNLGRAMQKLVKNASNEVFRTQTVYDSYGAPAVNSLPAYSGNQLKYQTNFMLNQNGQAYSYNDFDTPLTLNNNSSLQNGVTNSLGNYYSNLNSYDAYQAIADNPFSRTKLTGGGNVMKQSKPGNVFKMGSGKENYVINITSGDELKYVFGAVAANYFYSYKATRDNPDYMNSTPIMFIEAIKAGKQITIGPDNVETISYTVGDKVLAKGYSGLSSGEACNMTNVITRLSYYGTKTADIHLPHVNKTSLYLPLPTNTFGSNPVSADVMYSITDLYTDTKLVNGVDYTINSTTRNVVFYSTFLNNYVNRSLLLRISYAYTPYYQSYIDANNSMPFDAQVVYDLDYGRFSKNFYDLSGALRKSVSPKGFGCSSPETISMATTYDYSHLGQLIATKSPDEGLKELTYDKQGNLRFTQNAEQKLNNRFSYVNYDKHGRAYESGENTPVSVNSVWFTNYYHQGTGSGIWSWAVIDNQDGLRAVDKSNMTTTSYSVPTGTDVIPSGYTYQNLYTNFRNGVVNFIKNNNSTVWYNYDKLGRGLATITQITEPDFVSKNSNLNDRIKTTESTYDYFTGLTSTSTYQNNNTNEYLKYQFTYDANYRATTTQLTYGGTNFNLKSNIYNKMGQVKRVVIGDNFQGLDYIYTLNGGLKAINHPGLDPSLDPGGDNGDYSGSSNNVNKDLFGEIIDFYNGDYERNNSNIVNSISAGQSKYNGLIYATRFKTRDIINSTNTGANYINYPVSSTPLITSTNYKNQEFCFQYTYDQFNQLTGSFFGTYNNSSNAITAQFLDYRESGSNGNPISYDRNGNITNLARESYGGVTLDDLTYTNGSNNNQVSAIVDAANNSFGQNINFRTPSMSASSPFSYNAIGQMTTSSAENISSITYFPNGKIKKITFTSGNTSEYEYGAMGEKLKTKFYNGSVTKYTWYVGPYVYEFDQAGYNNFSIKEVKVPGGVIRVNNSVNVSSGYLVYHISDHLGNIRATFTKKSAASNGNPTGTGIEILSYNDYYAFGGQLPGRSYSSQNYRYGFQGQEKAEDGTIWDQFELRNYNHDLGLWFTPDPNGEFSSPYIAMANNPVSTIDPDGGLTSQSARVGTNFGQREDQMDRSLHTGQYSSENAQKQYEMYAQNIRDQYLLGVYHDSPRNVEKYLEAMQDLNNYFSGLKDNDPIGMGAGTTYLSISEISLNLNAVKEIVRTSPVSAREALKPELDISNGAEAYAMQMRDVSERSKLDDSQSAAAKNEARTLPEESRTSYDENGYQMEEQTYNTPSSDPVLGPAADEEIHSSPDNAVIQFIALVAGETGATGGHDEAQAIGEVILRRLDDNGATLEKGFINKIGGENDYQAIGEPIYNSIINSTWEEIASPNNPYRERIKGAIHALVSPQDNISKGAFFWNATDQLYHPERYGNTIGFNWKQWKKGVFNQTTFVGETCFFKYSDPKKTFP